jgi:gamma-glutamyltranspeptidase/glutathione hydrolase
VLDADGWACAATCTNGEGSGLVVPGTGVHVNNMMGEQDLSPLGFFTHPPGRRLPSMMAPTAVLSDGEPELVLGSAGSNRIRSALLQVIVNVIEHGMDAAAAVEAPRMHWEDGIVYAEPGIDMGALGAAGYELAPFRERNLFFGGCQAVERGPDGALSGGGDPRRGGAVVVA